MHSLSLGYHWALSLWLRKWLRMLILHLFCRVVDVKADPHWSLFFSQVWLNLGDHWSTHQIRSLHTHQHPLQRLDVWWDLHCLCAMLAQGSEDDYFWSRVTICHSLLGATTRVPRDSSDPQFSLSYAGRQPNRASKPNSRKICLELAWWNILVVRARICHGLSSHTTTSTKKVWKWHRSNYHTNVDVVCRSIGLSHERKL
jgi:hypothetical protein